MEEQLLPIVPFGRYKDKSVLELLADTKYVEWLKQQSWFPDKKQIYNIVVHQTIATSNNSNTPEHNRLQNLFLCKNIQENLISKLFKSNLNAKLKKKLTSLFNDEEVIRCFDINVIPKFSPNLDKSSIKFEDKFNWDIVLYYKDKQTFTIISNAETELSDKAKYKQQYDVEHREEYDNNLLLLDKLIDVRIKLDEQNMCIYETEIVSYTEINEQYDYALEIYLGREKKQNERDIANYEHKLKIYETKKVNFITQKQKEICLELGINYDNFVKWVVITGNDSYKDKDVKHTREEKIQLRDIIFDKLNPFEKEFDKINERPKLVEKIKIPTKPILPLKPNLENPIILYEVDKVNYDLFNKCKQFAGPMLEWRGWAYLGGNDKLSPVNSLKNYKKKYENEFLEHYEENFNKHYKKYRNQYYETLIGKYMNDAEIRSLYRTDETNETQYKITITICNYYSSVCCELKPTLSDDYPCVLRKLQTQIELTKTDRTTFGDFTQKYILIIGSFTSLYVSKENLITIFKQSNINIIFTDEIFEPAKSHAIEYINTEQVLSENKLVEENKTLKVNLLQTQQKLLQADEKIKQLEEEILLLKTKKQPKTINDYFGKK
jgi:hypothetical protein